MQKDQVLGIVGAAIGISVVDSIARSRAKAKLEDHYLKWSTERAHRSWREGYLIGFDQANSRLHYKIPREEYPTFE